MSDTKIFSTLQILALLQFPILKSKLCLYFKKLESTILKVCFDCLFFLNGYKASCLSCKCKVQIKISNKWKQVRNVKIDFSLFFQLMKKFEGSTLPRGRFPICSTKSSRKSTSSRSDKSTWTPSGDQFQPEKNPIKLKLFLKIMKWPQLFIFSREIYIFLFANKTVDIFSS